MADTPPGTPLWHDLTVPDAAALAPFYEVVCGWSASEHDMGDYADFDMTAPGGDRVAGLCHARGANAGLPPVWLMYVTVASLSDALAQVEAHGGTVIDKRGDTLAVIRDPAGAHLALWPQ